MKSAIAKWIWNSTRCFSMRFFLIGKVGKVKTVRRIFCTEKMLTSNFTSTAANLRGRFVDQVSTRVFAENRRNKFEFEWDWQLVTESIYHLKAQYDKFKIEWIASRCKETSFREYKFPVPNFMINQRYMFHNAIHAKFPFRLLMPILRRQFFEIRWFSSSLVQWLCHYFVEINAEKFTFQTFILGVSAVCTISSMAIKD